MPTAGVIILQAAILVKHFLLELKFFFRQRKKEYLSIFLEIAETGFEPATSGL